MITKEQALALVRNTGMAATRLNYHEIADRVSQEQATYTDIFLLVGHWPLAERQALHRWLYTEHVPPEVAEHKALDADDWLTMAAKVVLLRQRWNAELAAIQRYISWPQQATLFDT